MSRRSSVPSNRKFSSDSKELRRSEPVQRFEVPITLLSLGNVAGHDSDPAVCVGDNIELTDNLEGGEIVLRVPDRLKVRWIDANEISDTCKRLALAYVTCHHGVGVTDVDNVQLILGSSTSMITSQGLPGGRRPRYRDSG